MSRTKQEITNAVTNKLTSNLWQTLKTALLGKELISYASELVYATEQVKDSLASSIYIDSANIYGLISIANSLDIPLQVRKPATVKVSITALTTQYYPPYTLRFMIGSTTFTNIEFVSSDDTITLYQGNVKAVFSDSDQCTDDFMSFRVQETQAWTLQTEYTQSEYYSKYLKLSKYALVDSIMVFAKNSAVLPVQRYNPLKVNPDQLLYKIRTTQDKSVNVVWGNNLWGAGLDFDDNTYQVMWLELTNQEFNPETGSLKYVPIGTETTNTLECEVISYNQASDEDLEWIKNYVKSELAKVNVVATRSQIRDYVNNFSSVIDCSVVRPDSNPNRVTVYIKPRVDTDISFDDIKDHLIQYGELVTDYQVETGYPFLFTVLLDSSDTISDSIKTSITTYVQSLFPYEDLAYNAIINVAEISSLISQSFERSVIVNLIVTEYLSQDNKLTFIPQSGTIELLYSENVVGWDAAGLIYADEVSEAIDFSDAVAIGDYLLVALKTDGVINKLVTINSDTLLEVDVTNVLSSVLIENTKSQILTSYASEEYIGYMLQHLYFNTGFPTGVYTIVVYHNDASFKDGEFSIQRYNYSTKPPVFKADFDTNGLAYFDPKNVIIKGTSLYNIYLSNTLFIIQKWLYTEGAWSQVYYPIHVAVSAGDEVRGFVENDGDLIIFTSHYGHHIVVKEFETNPVLYQNIQVYGFSLFDELDLQNTQQGNAIHEVDGKIAWITSDLPVGVSAEDKNCTPSYEDLFGSGDIPVEKTIDYNLNILSDKSIYLKVPENSTLNAGVWLLWSPTAGNLDVYEYLSFSFIPNIEDAEYLKISFIKDIPGDYNLNVRFIVPALSQINFNYTLYSPFDYEQKIYLTEKPVFDMIRRQIKIPGAPIPVFMDQAIMPTSETVSVNILNGKYQARVTLKFESDGDGLADPVSKLTIASYMVDEDYTEFYLPIDQSTASDNVTRLHSIKQVGTVDYASRFVSLFNPDLYRYRYRVSGSNFKLDQTNYPKLDEVTWE